MAKNKAIAGIAAAPRLGRADIIAAALDLLDRSGLAAVTPRRLCDQLETDPLLVRRHFAQRQDLIAAIAAALIEPLDRSAAAASDWQDLLRKRAIRLRQAMLARRDGALLIAHCPGALRPHDRACAAELVALGFSPTAAEAAAAAIACFAHGWTVREQANEGIGAAAEARFGAAVDAVVTGLAPPSAAVDAAAQPIESSPAQPHILQLHLWNVQRLARESAEIAYSRTMQLIELDRRILLLLESHGALVPADVSASMGVDKAQVSRAVKRLVELGLITRDGVRSPLEVSGRGRTLTERMMRLAELRNRELTFGLSDAQIVIFFSVLEELMARAVLLLEQERKLMAAGRIETSLGYDDLASEADPANGAMVVERSRILPPMITLSCYTMRSAALAFKRLTGLSNFESWVLNDISRNPPMDWNILVQAINRDQSQAGRTVRRLIEMGLIERSGAPARRHGSFSPTAEGLRLHGLLEHAGRQRSQFLVQNLSPDQLRAFFAIFEIIAHNAEAQLSRERALDEMNGQITLPGDG